MTYPLREDIKQGTLLARVPLADILSTVAAILNQIDGREGAILISKTSTGRGWLLSVIPDDSTLEIKAGALRLKTGGVGSSHIAEGAVTANKLGAASVNTAALNTAAVTTTKIADGCVTARKTVGVNASLQLPSTKTLKIENGLITGIT